MIQTLGVVHFSIGVSDIERSTTFYTDVLGMEVVHRGSSLVFLKCGADHVVLARGEPGPSEEADTTVHHAFRVAAEAFDGAVETLGAHGAAPFLIERRESGVFACRPAYFHDPDGNVLEIHDGSPAPP